MKINNTMNIITMNVIVPIKRNN